jgi:hypothetical protein
VPSGEERRLVHQDLKIRSGEPRGSTGYNVELDVVRQRDLLGVHLEDTETTVEVGTGYDHTSIETTGTHKRWVKNVRTVCCGDKDNALIALETVHLYEELIEGLLSLVVTATHTRATVATDSVDLIDEDDTWGVLLSLNEEVTNTGRAHTHEHLHEIGA